MENLAVIAGRQVTELEQKDPYTHSPAQDYDL